MENFSKPTEIISDRPFWLEHFIFTHARSIIVSIIVITLFFAYQCLSLRPETNFFKFIPQSHPYIQNYLKHQQHLSLGNSIRVAVSVPRGDIFNKDYLHTLMQISDEIFLLPGVDRSKMRSLWTADTRWIEMVESGYRGGAVMPELYDGSAASVEQLKENIIKADLVGRLVATDFTSTLIEAPLLDFNPQTNAPLDYYQLSQSLEKLRTKYENATISIQIVGFAKLVGDLIEGGYVVVVFFLITLLTTIALLFSYFRSFKSTLILIACSFVAVIWQLGLMQLLHYGLDPFSSLLPFLIFAIAVSHGVQVINLTQLKLQDGMSSAAAARMAFRGLCIAGTIALLTDAIGFLVLWWIDIELIRQLSIIASIAIAVVVLTNLVLLPLLLSRCHFASTKPSDSFLHNSLDRLNTSLVSLCQFKPALLIVSLAVIMVALGSYYSSFIHIGDIHQGAPELRPQSRYNLDEKHIASHYSLGGDILVVMAETAPEHCDQFAVLDTIDKLHETLQTVPGVRSSLSLVNWVKLMVTYMQEGNWKWYDVPRTVATTSTIIGQLPEGVVSRDCDFIPILVFLTDHKAETLNRVTATIASFAQQANSAELVFKLAAGNAGVIAATNQLLAHAHGVLIIVIYAVIALLCLVTFRSVKAVICIVVPLAVTSVLCQALMVYLDIGIKVATLPVIALGVGIGVDYGIYVYSRLQYYLKQGLDFPTAYFNTLQTTGRAVVLTAMTLALGVVMWTFSPIKFQADMGILLTFMFLWSLLSTLILLPALYRLLSHLRIKRG